MPASKGADSADDRNCDAAAISQTGSVDRKHECCILLWDYTHDDHVVSDGVFPGPLARSRLVASSVGLVDMCNLRHKRVIRVGIGEHGADGKKDLCFGQHTVARA